MRTTSLAVVAETPAHDPGTPSLRLVTAPDEAHDRVAKALRAARVRTGLGERQVVDKLAARGCEVDIEGLQRAEEAGVIALALASALADLYGTTTDCLAGRRLNRQSLPVLSPDRR
jgi:hypothetical protein